MVYNKDKNGELKSYFDVSDENSFCDLLNFISEKIEIMEKERNDFNEFNDSYDSNETSEKEEEEEKHRNKKDPNCPCYCCCF